MHIAAQDSSRYELSDLDDDDGYDGEFDDEEEFDADDDLEEDDEVTERERARREALSNFRRTANARVAGERAHPYTDVRLGYLVDLFTSPRFADLDASVRHAVLLRTWQADDDLVQSCLHLHRRPPPGTMACRRAARQPLLSWRVCRPNS